MEMKVKAVSARSSVPMLEWAIVLGSKTYKNNAASPASGPHNSPAHRRTNRANSTPRRTMEILALKRIRPTLRRSW